MAPRKVDMRSELTQRQVAESVYQVLEHQGTYFDHKEEYWKLADGTALKANEVPKTIDLALRTGAPSAPVSWLGTIESWLRRMLGR
jgi:hypothetical protein